MQPDKTAVITSTLTPATVLTRGFQPKVQQMQALHAQSDYSGRAQALGLTHEIQAGDHEASSPGRQQQASCGHGSTTSARIASPEPEATAFGCSIRRRISSAVWLSTKARP